MIDQSLVQSGFDVETLLSETYLTNALLTALDAGLIPAGVEFGDPPRKARLQDRAGAPRLYQPDFGQDGPGSSARAFDVELLFGHPSGADVRVRVVLKVDGALLPIPVDLFVTLAIVKTRDDEGALASAGLAIHVVDVDSPVFTSSDFPPKAEVLPKIQEAVDRTIDVAGVSSFKRVEEIELGKHPADADHQAAVGLYVNVRLRTGPQEHRFLDARGNLDAAINFLPAGEDVAFASRPGLYHDLSVDSFERTAFRNDRGEFEHVLRKSPFDPKSQRVGTVDSVTVSQLVIATPNGPLPQNALRIDVKGVYELRPPDFDPNLHITIDIKPRIDDNGFLQWDSDLHVNVNALFEFLTLFGFAFLAAGFGLNFALGALGLLFLTQVGAGVVLAQDFQDRVEKRVDATFTDVIPDRLKLARRRWDPFFTTLHEVVTKPSQITINGAGILLAGTAFVGRQGQPGDDVVIRDEFRTDEGALAGLRYRVPDSADIQADLKDQAPGTIRFEYERQEGGPEPDLYDLTLDQIKARLNDTVEGPFLNGKVPYFPARVHVVQHEIDQVLCLSDLEVRQVQAELRDAFESATRDRIRTEDGEGIRQQVIADLSAGGGTPTEAEIQAEVDARIEARVADVMGDHDDPPALSLADELRPRLRFDLSPVEFVTLIDNSVLTLDGVDVVHDSFGRRPYIRDHPNHDPKDNLLNRPRYTPSPTGPVFP